MHAAVTTALDVLGLLLLAAGLGLAVAGCGRVGAGFATAGLVVLAGSVAAATVRPRVKRGAP